MNQDSNQIVGTQNIMLAQSNATPSSTVPEPSKGQRIILDERAPQPTPNQASTSIPTSVYYWLGVVLLLAIAIAAAVSFFKQSKNDH